MSYKKLEAFEDMQTDWQGLWYDRRGLYFSSGSFSFAQLRKFKGNVRLFVKKNRFYNNGENGRPNYVFCLRDSHSDIENALDYRKDINGSWIRYDRESNSWECSVCENTVTLNEGTPHENNWDFCPYCGARLKRELIDWGAAS